MADIREEERIARLEEKVEFLTREVQEVKRDVKELREDLYRVEASLRDEIHRLDKKFTVLLLIVIFLIIFLNQSSLELILRVLGVMR